MFKCMFLAFIKFQDRFICLPLGEQYLTIFTSHIKPIPFHRFDISALSPSADPAPLMSCLMKQQREGETCHSETSLNQCDVLTPDEPVGFISQLDRHIAMQRTKELLSRQHSEHTGNKCQWTDWGGNLHSGAMLYFSLHCAGGGRGRGSLQSIPLVILSISQLIESNWQRSLHGSSCNLDS